jgi:protein-arginine kinase activator protein McsA
MSDKMYQVGEEIEALCKTCKDATVHVIEIIKGDQVTKVMCKSCLSSHRFRKPEEVLIAKKQAKKKEAKKPMSPATKSQRKWSRLISKSENESPKTYQMNETYAQNDVIEHTKFGTGVVVTVIDPSKISVVFEEGEKTLIQNRF